MVLRIKEREEAIQLLAMDLQVCGKLLTLHRKGNRVDVETLHNRIPLQQDAGKGPLMGSHGYRRLRRRKSVFVDAPIGLGIQAKEIGRWSHVGPTGAGARPPSLWMPRGSSDFISKSPGCLLVQEKSSRRFHSVWAPFGIPFLQNSKLGKKIETSIGPSVNRLVPKII